MNIDLLSLAILRGTTTTALCLALKLKLAQYQYLAIFVRYLKPT